MRRYAWTPVVVYAALVGVVALLSWVSEESKFDRAIWSDTLPPTFWLIAVTMPASLAAVPFLPRYPRGRTFERAEYAEVLYTQLWVLVALGAVQVLLLARQTHRAQRQ